MAEKPLEVRHASDSDITTVLGRQDRVRGDVHVAGGLRVDGIVRGNIEPGGKDSCVIVSTGGRVEGDIHAARVRMDGSVAGNLHVEGHLDVSSEAVIDGNVTYGSMTIAEGARIDGRLQCSHSDFDERE